MKKVIKYIIIGILGIVLLFISYRLLTNKLNDINANKYKNIINDANKDKEVLVFIEINPKLALVIKNDKVVKLACLNNDCTSISNEIDVKGKDLNNAIDIIYNKCEEKGFDTSSGVQIKSTSIINVDKKEFINVEYITIEKEKELLSEVINNEEITIDNSDYENSLLDKLKKDKDYDNVYTCTDEESLECHIILNTGINDDSDYDYETNERREFINNLFTGSTIKVMSTLKKFGFEVENNKVIINGITFGYVPLFTFNESGTITKYKNALVAEILDVLDPEICSNGYVSFDENGECKNKDGFYVIELNKTDISKGTIAKENITEIRLGSTENRLQMYNITHGWELEEQAWKERAKRCIGRVTSLGYTHTLNDYEYPCCVEGEEVPEGGCYSCDPYESGATYCRREVVDGYAYDSCSTLYSIIENEINCE